MFERIKSSRLYPVLLLENMISRRGRRFLRFMVAVVTLILLLYLEQTSRWLGLVIILATIILILHLLESFFRSYYFSSIITNRYRREDLFTFTVGRILCGLRDDNDVLKVFMLSETGSLVLGRLGVMNSEIQSFLKARTQKANMPTLSLAGAEPLTLAKLADWLYSNNEEFAKFLFRHEINQPELVGAVAWIVSEIERKAIADRWWSRERLGRIPGLAKDWSFGQTFILDRYSEDLLLAQQSSGFRQVTTVRRDEVRQLENVLLRSQESNALIIGPAGEAKMDIIWQFANEIKSGFVVPALEHRRPVLLHSALLIADHRERDTFEQAMLQIMNEAARAGNIILIIDDLSVLLAGARRLGSELTSLLDPYLGAAILPIVALVETDSYQQSIAGVAELARRFEVIRVSEIDRSRLIIFLEEVAVDFEKKMGIFFTYQSIVALVESAGRYFQTDSISDRALDLMVELVPWAVSNGEKVVGREEVLAFVSQKTKIPAGSVSTLERETLLGLEQNLQRQVIGQGIALRAISQALRRSRAGTANRGRPIGSFLFLGPTGVGKTETAKALARTLFNREEALLRLDMSEYQSGDALNRLIGSFAENKQGILANLLRQNPYGVLLLDEFEKTNQQVLNLFLQILDEGFFSDAFGRRVNTRNIIFIATSNAAAEMIWGMVEAGRDPSTARDELVNHLIKRSLFRPELLNRFDEIVIFHPLVGAELFEVARLLLNRLVVRLRNQGIELKLNDDLINRVADAGTNRVFGARPLARFIQDKVEQAVADKIISGEVGAGMRVEFLGGKLIIL